LGTINLVKPFLIDCTDAGGRATHGAVADILSNALLSAVEGHELLNGA